MTRVVVATLQRGRHAQLANQARGLLAQTVAPAGYVIVSMDGDAPAPADSDARAPRPLSGWPDAAPTPLHVVPHPVDPAAPLPLAAARNRAAAVAEEAGADLLVMLDVDCIPSPRLVERFDAAHRETGGGAILLGPVGRLAAGDVALDEAAALSDLAPSDAALDPATRAAAEAREPRPVPAGDALERQPRPELFWSLSYALAPAVHRAAGGYDEGYVGYGAEDTDFGLAAAQAGVELWTVGGAWAYHQHHPVSSPPREHLADIVRNARRFHGRWGRWPMTGWLAAFAAEGLVEWEPGGGRLEVAACSRA